MTKENPYDRVVNKALARVERVTDRIAGNFKGVNPFDREEISSRQLLDAFNTLRPEDMDYLLSKHGVEAINELVFEMDKVQRRIDNAQWR